MTAPATADTAESQMGALSKLIQETNDRGVSYQEMANKAVDPETGTRLHKQALQKIVRNPPVNPPSIAQMRAIATATERPLRHIQEAAAAQWLEYEATELAGYDEEVRIIVGHLAGKSKADLLRWRMMMEAEDRARRESGE